MEPIFLVYNRIGTLRRVTVQILERLGFDFNFQAGTIDQTIALIKEHGKNMVVLIELSAGLSRVDELDFVQRMAFKIPIIVTLPITDHQFILQFHDAGARKILLKTDNLEKFEKHLKMALTELKYAIPDATAD